MNRKYIRSNYKGDIKGFIETTARVGSKAFSAAVDEYEDANGFPRGTFHYIATHGARGATYPKPFKRF